MRLPWARHPRLGVEDALVLIAVVVLPWAFGGVEMWAYRPAALLLAGALALGLLRRGTEALGLAQDARWLLPAFLLAGWAALQVVPLPPPILGVVTPTAGRIYRETIPGFPGHAPEDIVLAIESAALERIPEARGDPEPEPEGRPPGFSPDPGPDWSGWRGISPHPAMTVERLLWYLALLAAFLHVRRRATDPTSAAAYRVALFGLFASLAALGLLQKLTWNGKLLWLRHPYGGGNPFGPYVDGTHFAGLMEIAVPWLLGFAWDRFAQQGRRALREPGAVLGSLASGGCFAAGLATSSKMAALLLVAGVLVLFATSVEGTRARLLALASATLVVAGAAIALAGSGLGERVRAFVDSTGGSLAGNERLLVWAAMGTMVRDFAWTGSGLGTFRSVFPGYQPAGEALVWTQAHNEYLEVLLDGGLVAAALTGWLAWGFWTRAFSRWVPPEGRRPSAAERGLVLGLFCLSLHALVDFSFQIPANALVFVTAAALACAARTREGRRTDRPRSRGLRALPMSRVLVSTAVAAIVGLYGAWAGRGVVAGVAYARGVPLAQSARYDEALPLLRRAAVGSQRLEALWLGGEVRLGLWDRLNAASRGGENGLRLIEEAASDYLKAAAACPASGWPWSGLAETYERLELVGRPTRKVDLAFIGNGRWAAIGRPGRVAVGMARIAIAKEPNVAAHHDRHALILLALGLDREGLLAVRASARAFPEFDAHAYGRLDPIPRSVLEAFAEGSRQALGKAPLLSRGRHLLSLGQLEWRLGRLEQAESDIRAALREPADIEGRAGAQFHLALVLMDQNRRREASEAFERAARAPVFRGASAILRARISEAEGKLEEALEHLAEARGLEPRDVSNALEYARLARRLKRWDSAVQALRSAIVVEPSQGGPRVELVRTYLEKGDVAAAEFALREFEREVGSGPETARLSEEIARGRAGEVRSLPQGR